MNLGASCSDQLSETISRYASNPLRAWRVHVLPKNRGHSNDDQLDVVLRSGDVFRARNVSSPSKIRLSQ